MTSPVDENARRYCNERDTLRRRLAALGLALDRAEREAATVVPISRVRALLRPPTAGGA